MRADVANRLVAAAKEHFLPQICLRLSSGRFRSVRVGCREKACDSQMATRHQIQLANVPTVALAKNGNTEFGVEPAEPQSGRAGNASLLGSHWQLGLAINSAKDAAEGRNKSFVKSRCGKARLLLLVPKL
jgi:hypothetical protein